MVGKYNTECPLECNSERYMLTASSQNFPSYFYRNYLATHRFQKYLNKSSANLTPSDVDDSIARLNVYFQSMGYQLITEIPQMTEINLLANTGGMLGLFMGMSFLSFIEVFEMSLVFLFLSLKKAWLTLFS